MQTDTPAAEEREFNPAEHVGEYMGRAYMDVAHRLLWLDHEHPQYTVDTTILHYGPDYAVVKAELCIYSHDGTLLRRAVAHGQAHSAAMPKHISARYLEKAETAAVGRALQMLGLGTLNGQEFDDTEHLADSPVERPTRGPITGPAGDPFGAPADNPALACIQCGRQFKDKDTANGFWAADKQYESAVRKYGKALCYPCSQKGA